MRFDSYRKLRNLDQIGIEPNWFGTGITSHSLYDTWRPLERIEQWLRSLELTFSPVHCTRWRRVTLTDHLRLELAGFSSSFDTDSMSTMFLGSASRWNSLETLGSDRSGPQRRKGEMQREAHFPSPIDISGGDPFVKVYTQTVRLTSVNRCESFR